MINCDELKKRIGYTGDSNQRLVEAITHRSYAVENNLKYDNQRLEFLGDAVLELILTEYLYDRYPDAPEGYRKCRCLVGYIAHHRADTPDWSFHTQHHRHLRWRLGGY